MDYLTQDWDSIQASWRRAWARKDKGNDTIHYYISNVDAYLLWCKFEGGNSTSLETADSYVYHREGDSKYAARNAATALKALGRHLADLYEEPDPFKKLVVPKTPPPIKVPAATDEDLEKLLATCDDSWTGQRDRAIILTLASTGMRRGEVANIAPEDIDLVSETLHIPKTKTKTPRIVHLPEPLIKALLQWKRVNPVPTLQWPGATGQGGTTGKANTPSGIGAMLKRREKQALGHHLGAHAWRRRYAGNWIRNGGTEVGLMAYAGWSSTEMIARYTKSVAQENAINEAKRLMG